MKYAACLALLLAFAPVLVGTAQAERAFGLAFNQKYVPSNPSDDLQQQWQVDVRKAGCYVCHVKGQPKEYCNAYGDALSQYLDRGDKSPDSISSALQQAEPLSDTSGTKFGELFRRYQLPQPELGPKSQAKAAAATTGAE